MGQYPGIVMGSVLGGDGAGKSVDISHSTFQLLHVNAKLTTSVQVLSLPLETKATHC